MRTRTPFAIAHKDHGLALADEETFPDMERLGWKKAEGKTVDDVAESRQTHAKPRAKRGKKSDQAEDK